MKRKPINSIRVGNDDCRTQQQFDADLMNAIIEIQNLLNTNFGWMMIMNKIALQEKSLQTIIKAIKKLKTNPQQGETNAR